MRRSLLAVAVLAPLGVLTQFAAAQPVPAPAPQAAASPGAGPGMRIEANQIRAKDLMDRDVYSTDNVEIGEIEDLIIDPVQGRVVTAVIEVENRLGLTDKYVAVPLSRLRMTPGERRISIDLSRDQIRSLPGINYRD